MQRNSEYILLHTFEHLYFGDFHNRINKEIRA